MTNYKRNPNNTFYKCISSLSVDMHFHFGRTMAVRKKLQTDKIINSMDKKHT